MAQCISQNSKPTPGADTLRYSLLPTAQPFYQSRYKDKECACVSQSKITFRVWSCWTMRWEGAETNTELLLNLHCEARTSFSELARLMSSKKELFSVLIWALKVDPPHRTGEVHRICTPGPRLGFPVCYETQLIFFFMSIARTHKKICFGIVIFPLMKPL